MKILFMCSEPPFPAINGVRIPAYNFIKILAEDHDVFLIAFSDLSTFENQQSLQEMQNLCSGVIYLKSPPRRNKAVLLYKLFFQSKPHFVHQPLYPPMVEAIRKVLKEFNPDIVHFDFITLIEYQKIVAGRKSTVISPNDSCSLAYENQLAGLKLGPLMHPASCLMLYKNKLLLYKTRRYEAKFYAKFDRCHVVSFIDAQYLKKLNPRIPVTVIPNGVDTEYFCPFKRPDEKAAIFVGPLLGENVMYLKIFIKNAWEEVVRRHPDAKFYIVGKKLSPGFDQWCKGFKGVVLLGFVKDTRIIYAKSLIVVNPVLKNYGIFNKTIEGMAMARPVVGMKISFSGIPECKNGQEVIAAQDYDTLINEIDKLFRYPDLALKMGKKARLLIEKNYSWRQRKAAIYTLYENAIDNFRGQENAGKEGSLKPVLQKIVDKNNRLRQR